MKSKISISFLVLLMLASFTSIAQRKRYGGRKHSQSHGGHYSSGRGSSHKGGHYKNNRTGNHYGRHKK